MKFFILTSLFSSSLFAANLQLDCVTKGEFHSTDTKVKGPHRFSLVLSNPANPARINVVPQGDEYTYVKVLTKDSLLQGLNENTVVSRPQRRGILIKGDSDGVYLVNLFLYGPNYTGGYVQFKDLSSGYENLYVTVSCQAQ